MNMPARIEQKENRPSAHDSSVAVAPLSSPIGSERITRCMRFTPLMQIATFSCNFAYAPTVRRNYFLRHTISNHK